MNGHQSDEDHHIRFIPLSYSYDDADSHESALRLVTSIRPEWAEHGSSVELARFTDGITNTLLKALPRRHGLSTEDADREAILLRAYGHGTEMLIDRLRETQNHELLMHHGLAPTLLARFHNGMMYRFIRGAVTQPEDLRKPQIYRAVAHRLAQWHATVPCLSAPTGYDRKNAKVEDCPGEAAQHRVLSEHDYQRMIDQVAPGKPPPNVWTVMQKWILALPTKTQAQRTRQEQLQTDLTFLVDEFSQRPGLGENGLVFAHCDLLSGNIIVLPQSDTNQTAEAVTFIDYEYATPSPAAFDLANHFAEWGGFGCDYHVLPTRAQRREFIDTYIKAYFSHQDEARARPDRNTSAGPREQRANGDTARIQDEVNKLLAEVDHFRGVPGFYWGIWSLIQATISEIDFDYASYAEVRLGEYYAWRAELDGSRQREGKEMPLREKRWAQEA